MTIKKDIFKLFKKVGLEKLLIKRSRKKRFLKDKQKLSEQLALSNNKLWSFDAIDYPILIDWDDTAGVMSGHYFHQDLYVASEVYRANPERHVDIGSRIDGFVAHVASYREIEILDIRAVESDWTNIKFRQADLMDSGTITLEYTDSISSLHAIEHFGLGRYGDPIDLYGYLKAIENIYKMLKPGGTFYFSVPIGPQRIVFNAHRVFSLRHVLDIIDGKFNLVNFSYVDDQGNLHRDVKITEEALFSNFNCKYGCGIFTLKKSRSI